MFDGRTSDALFSHFFTFSSKSVRLEETRWRISYVERGGLEYRKFFYLCSALWCQWLHVCVCVCVCAHASLWERERFLVGVYVRVEERESKHFENVCVLLDVDTRVLELKRVYTIAERERSDVCACVWCNNLLRSLREVSSTVECETKLVRFRQPKRKSPQVWTAPALWLAMHVLVETKAGLRNTFVKKDKVKSATRKKKWERSWAEARPRHSLSWMERA